MAQELFSEDAVLMFHSRSKDAPPGKGVGEFLAMPASTFFALARFENWRQRLSNFDPAPFTLDGLRWASVEHCFQATKFDTIDPMYYRSFSLDSGSLLSREIGAAVKSAGGKKGRPMTPAQCLDWEKRKWVVMRAALEAKYRENAIHREILLATYPAKLTHRPLRSSHTQVEMGLMQVRFQLWLEREHSSAASNSSG